MSMKIKPLYIILGIVVVLLLMSNAPKKEASTNGSTITRVLPAQATVGTNFDVTLNIDVVGADDFWTVYETIPAGATVITSPTSYNCAVASGYLTCVVFSGATDGSITYTLRKDTAGTLTFQGKYLFGTDSVQSNIDGPASVNVVACSPNCACASSTCTGQTCANGCGGTCAGSKNDTVWSPDVSTRCTTETFTQTGTVCSQTRQATGTRSAVCNRPVDQCVEALTVSNGCSGFCTGSWTVVKNTEADTSCNNCISQSELNTFIPIFRANPGTKQVIMNQVISVWRGNPTC